MREIRADRHLARRGNCFVFDSLRRKMALRFLTFVLSNCLWKLNIRRVGKAKCVFFFSSGLGGEVTSPLTSTSDSIEKCSGDSIGPL